MIFFGYKNSLNAQLTILHHFGDGTVANDGAHPRAGLTHAPTGQFFGSTANQAATPSTFAGTIFQMSSSGMLKIIYSFGSTSTLYTTQPLLYHYGKLIGVALSGESTTGSSGNVFRLKRSATTGNWSISFWHNFTNSAPDYDGSPAGNVILGSDENFYGTSEAGGSPLFNDGAVYKLDRTTHTLTNVYTFPLTGYFQPHAAVVQGTDGNFYGSTFLKPGGTIPTQWGSFFKLTPAGQIAVFTPTVDTAVEAPLIQASDGNFYGVSEQGLFSFSSIPCVFNLTPSGVFSILHTFGQGSDGAIPIASGTVVEGPKGNLYGVTFGGGIAGKGIIYELSKDGTSYTILHNFGDGSVPNDGANPTGTLIVVKNTLYGTTYNGGSAGLGTVFKYTLP